MRIRFGFSVLIICVVLAVWAYQMITPELSVDPALYGVILILTLAAGIGVWGEGKMNSALEILNSLNDDE